MLGSGASGSGKNRTPTGRAYRWVKGISGWTNSPLAPDTSDEIGVPDEPGEDETGIDDAPDVDSILRILRSQAGSGNVVPAADQLATELEAENWATWWKVGEAYDDPFENAEYKGQASDDFSKLASLTASDIRRAARSFPIGTGVGVDNISPRAIDRLTEEALDSLVYILHACEKNGEWGRCNNLVLTVLLPKADGGVRPIGLLPTVTRIWMRARNDVARKWEAENADPSLFGGKGMGAQKAAWLAAFRAELADGRNTEKVQTLLDMTKAFETIPHKKLVETARKYKYNLALLRLSLAAYRVPRTVGIDGVCSAPMTATRGITAGSGFATTELRILMQEVVMLTLAEWGNGLCLTLYVDDLTIERTGTIIEAAAKGAAAVDFICKILEEQMGFTVSEKSVVVA